jgi:predicted HTH transcriptional regulator
MDIHSVLNQREGLHLDFKQRISQPAKIAKTLCAFANTYGGVLYIGISDQRKVTGIDPEEEKFQLEKAANEYCNPPVGYTLEEVEDDENHTILVVKIPEGEHKPYATLQPGAGWQVYIRQHDKSLPADKKLSQQLEVLPDKNPAYQLNKEEERILDFVSGRDKTTLVDVVNYLNYGKRRARKILIKLSLQGVIREFNHEATPYYAQ